MVELCVRSLNEMPVAIDNRISGLFIPPRGLVDSGSRLSRHEHVQLALTVVRPRFHLRRKTTWQDSCCRQQFVKLAVSLMGGR
jgi:hypothetical protein